MPRDTLTRDQIVTAAVELLDADGLAGLNMRALGARLGSAATAVYWHVGSKDNLIALAGDHVWGEIPLPDLDTTDWRAAATQLATEMHAMLLRHTWMVQAFGTYPVYGPGKARHDDHGLALFEAAGFPGAQADRAMATVYLFVLGNALGAAAEVSLTKKLNRDGGEKLVQDVLAKAGEAAEKFPRLRARLGTSGADYAAAPEHTFEYGLQIILDGLQAQLSG
jgi:AcrR family transcriptional regulator